MAKVEIELEDLVSLKEENFRLQNEVISLTQQLREIDNKAVEVAIADGAEKLFRAYLEKTFTHLGFQFDDRQDSVIAHNPWGTELERWMKNPDTSVKLGARMFDNWKRAFLKIGVFVKEEDNGKA